MCVYWWIKLIWSNIWLWLILVVNPLDQRGFWNPSDVIDTPVCVVSAANILTGALLFYSIKADGNL